MAPDPARIFRPSIAGPRRRPLATAGTAPRRRTPAAGRPEVRSTRASGPRGAFRANHRRSRGSARATSWQPRSPRPRREPTRPAAPAQRASDSPTATAAAAATTTAITAASTGAARTTARAALLRDIDPERASSEVLAVEVGDRLPRGVRTRHLDEAESARLTAHTIEHQVDGLYFSGGCKVLCDEVLGGVVGQVAHIQSARHGLRVLTGSGDRKANPRSHA